MDGAGRFQFGEVLRNAVLAARRGWLPLGLIVGAWVIADLALGPYDRKFDPPIPGWSGLPLQVSYSLAAACAFAAMTLAAIGAARGQAFSPVAFLHHLGAATPTILVVAFIFEGPDILAKSLIAVESIRDAVTLAANVIQCLLFCVFCTLIPVDLDRRLGLRKSVGEAARLTRRSRWRIAVLFFALSLIVLIPELLVSLFVLDVGLGVYTPVIHVTDYASGLVMALAIGGLYVDLRRIDNLRQPDAVAETFA